MSKIDIGLDEHRVLYYTYMRLDGIGLERV